MKKIIKVLAGSLCFLMLWGEPAYAGSLNANESELVSIISGTYTYEGITYKVKDLYIDMAIDYLMQDNIDLTDEQKQAAIQKMYSSVAQGISEGYLEPVNNAESESNKNGATGGTSDAVQGSVGPNSMGSTGLETEEGSNVEQGLSNPEENTTEQETEAETTKSPIVLSLESLSQNIIQNDNSADQTLSNRLPSEYPHYKWKLAWGICIAASIGIISCIVAAAKNHMFMERKRKKKGRA